MNSFGVPKTAIASIGEQNRLTPDDTLLAAADAALGAKVTALTGWLKPQLTLLGGGVAKEQSAAAKGKQG